MSKKILLILCAALISCYVMAGCGKSTTSAENSASDAPVSETVDTPSETAEPESSEVETAEPEASVTETAESAAMEAVLEDGVYTANFTTDSSMFHVNEALNGEGVLTVENGQMYIHVSLVSKGILNLYVGLAEDAQKDGAVLLQPTEDTIDYNDGTTDVVYGFDIPVPYLDEEFDLAIIGKKGIWYDHKVSVSNAVLQSE